MRQGLVESRLRDSLSKNKEKESGRENMVYSSIAEDEGQTSF